MECDDRLKKILGFSLVELSIVLVILGLLVGGILSGKSLIHSAEIKATIAQVDAIKVATRAFQDKYFYLPGDIPAPYTTNLQLSTSPWGSGNGDGVMSMHGSSFATGEANLFFVQLGQKGFIAGSYSVLGVNEDSPNVGRYIMQAKLSGNYYFYVWSGGPDPCHSFGTCMGTDGINYISLDVSTRYCDFNICGVWGTNATMPPVDAYNIDMKVDDGKPQSGSVQAFYMKFGSAGQWAGGEFHGTGLHTEPSGKPSTAANAAGTTNCYDNGGVAGVAQSYTTTNSNTCAISFKM